jgi:trigger factor
MKTTIEDISPVKKKLMIEIEPEEVNKKINETFRELGKSAKIPGFRPGKIPRKVLERYFGNRVMEDVTRALVNETLPKAVEETKAFPLTRPVVENETLKLGQNFKYSALMEVKPEFELKDYMGLEAEKEICAVSDEDVAKQLEKIREATGKLTSIGEERGIEEDDCVSIEYEGFEGHKAIEGIKSTNFLLKIGSNDFHPDFEKNLIGLKKEETAEIKVDFEDNYHHSRLAGKSVNFKVKVLDIQEMNLPELNDDFAKSLSADLDNLSDLKKKLKEDLTAREENRIDRELKMRLIKKISDSVDFELPGSIVESEINYAMENLRQNLTRRGSSLEKAGLEEEKLREGLRTASEKRVKEMLILGEIAGQNNLSVNEMELSEGFREAALNMGQEPEALRKYYADNDLVDSFRQKLLEEKALNYLVKGAKVFEVEAEKIQDERG